MSGKDPKLIVKEIREEIKCKRYEEAIAKCEILLKDDNKNYMGYLLLGAAQQQNSNKIEAAKNLRKAIELSPAAPTVALQGLANCAPPDELPKIYEQLLALVPEKFADYYDKLFVLSGNAAATQECFAVFKREAGRCSDERLKRAYKYLGQVWIAYDCAVADDDDEQLLITCLEELVADDQLDVHLQANKRYLKLLYKRKELSRCIAHACLVAEQYPSDANAFEWICKIYCERHNDTVSERSWQSELKEPIEHYTNTLLALNENSSLALLIKAFDLYAQQQYVAARDLIYRVQAIQPGYAVALELLARTEMCLGAFGRALPLWQQLRVRHTEYALCLSHSAEKQELTEAIEILVEMEQNETVLSTLARCYFKLNELEKLKALSLDILSKAEYLMSPSDAVALLLASGNMETFPTLLLLGRLQLQLVHYSEALNCMLRATRLQPNRSECFYYLGKIYYATSDMVRARKCFEKCIHLNPQCEDAVNNLSAIYQQLGEEDLNVTLLLNTLKYMRPECTQHINYKLGLHFLSVKKWDDAIHAFRTAIKCDVGCLIYWESLGDAYAERGSYNSAIRVFQKILEMNASNIYAKLQIALIKTTVRMYPEAIDDFAQLLRQHPDYLPGLKGAAEANIGLAHNLRLEHRYTRSKAHLQLAVNHLQRAFLTLGNNDMVWLWRLTANVFMLTARLPASLANLDVAGKLAKRDAETTLLTQKDLLNLAVKFYKCALKIKQNTYLWYELAVCCYNSAVKLPEEAEAHIDLAKEACEMAITAQDNRWQNWNLLGVINLHAAVNNLPVAQHCFVQALTLERKSYVAWTNLGALYLHLNEIKLANQAFQRAQQSSPVYPHAWYGQAMIAEAIGEEEEALDLFRHCQQFEYHDEASLGYAHWVCAILSDAEKCMQPHYKHAIDSMYADVVALDAINWHVINKEDAASVAALSFQGMLNERQKLYQAAIRAYTQAVRQGTAGADRDKILTNLGYLYLKLEKPNDAINAFNMITHATFRPIIGLALAYFRAGQYEESYAVYNSVLNSVSGNEDDKAARILVAMASMVYASQGEDDTKTLLYQCILLKDSPIQALYSACACGLLHGDNQLVETILMELKNYENHFEHCAHISYLTAQHLLAKTTPRKALLHLVSRVHIFPHCAELRKVLANFMQENFAEESQYHMATGQIALSAIDLVHQSKSQKNDCVEDAKILLIASRAFTTVDSHRSLKLLQRAVHLHPCNESAWHALLTAR